ISPSRMTISTRPATAPACSSGASTGSTEPCRPTSPPAVTTASSASSTSERGTSHVFSVNNRGHDERRDEAGQPLRKLPAGSADPRGRRPGAAVGLREPRFHHGRLGSRRLPYQPPDHDFRKNGNDRSPGRRQQPPDDEV